MPHPKDDHQLLPEGEPLDVRSALQAALGLGATVSGLETESPILPLTATEPPPRSRLPEPPALGPATGSIGAEPARVALLAAIQGEAYNARDLPDARAMLVGIARAIVAYGVSPADLVNAVMDALHE